MKNRILTAMLISVLALPALAQGNAAPAAQNPDQSQAQSQATAQAQDQAPSTASQPAAVTTESATGKPLQPPAREGFWGHLNPFARKKYVQRQTGPIRDRLNELDELSAANGKMIKDVDTRSQQGIQLASARVTEADQHAIDAGNKAQAAQQTATQANTRLSTVEQVVGNLDQYKATNQTEIRFRPGQTVLSKQAKDALDEMATPLKGQHGYVIEVQGFSSGQGQTAIASSRRMADSVERYLVLNREIPAYRIYVVGMGNVPAAQHATGTRVEVSVMKNDLDQTAKQ